MTKYAVVIHEEAEGGILAGSTGLAGVRFAGGAVPDLMEDVREAIAGVVAVLRGVRS